MGLLLPPSSLQPLMPHLGLSGADSAETPNSPSSPRTYLWETMPSILVGLHPVLQN